MNEVELLKGLNHRNIVKYLGSVQTPGHLYIILEYVENGSLADVVKQSNFGPFPEALVAVHVQQVLQVGTPTPPGTPTPVGRLGS